MKNNTSNNKSPFELAEDDNGEVSSEGDNEINSSMVIS